MNEKYEDLKEQEFPEYIVQAISDVITQYVLEYDLKDQQAILRFSNFSEYVMKEIQQGIINALDERFSDTDFIMDFLSKRKNLIKNNIKLYTQLSHLEKIDIPDYALDAIINGINYINKEKELFLDFENKDFYCLFGENLILDIRNYMQLEKIKK
jgi:hypothetical protein